VPRPAATVMVVRDAGDPPSCLEVCLLERGGGAFGRGLYVFPGGQVDPGDADGALAGGWVDADDRWASRLLGLDAGGLAFFVAAAREVLEEVGVFLGRSRLGSAADAASIASLRAALRRRESSLAEALAAQGLVLELRRLRYVSHWVTPVGMPRRFDTRFFVAPLPAGQDPSPDEAEVLAVRFEAPARALDRYRRGELPMIVPTVAHLELLASFASVGSLLAELDAALAVPAGPSMVAHGNGRRVRLARDGAGEESVW
jgi:8-oxo-dGTP pyrophosphatase MutT (NUDIX family)